MEQMEYQPLEQAYDERVVEIARVAKVVKGGRRFQFRVTIVTGDNHGKIGIGIGKANAVPDAMRKATERAHKNMRQVILSNTTIPHEVTGRTAGAVILLKPASPGTGVQQRANFTKRSSTPITSTPLSLLRVRALGVGIGVSRLANSWSCAPRRWSNFSTTEAALM